MFGGWGRGGGILSMLLFHFSLSLYEYQDQDWGHLYVERIMESNENHKRSCDRGHVCEYGTEGKRCNIHIRSIDNLGWGSLEGGHHSSPIYMYHIPDSHQIKLLKSTLIFIHSIMRVMLHVMTTDPGLELGITYRSINCVFFLSLIICLVCWEQSFRVTFAEREVKVQKQPSP